MTLLCAGQVMGCLACVIAEELLSLSSGLAASVILRFTSTSFDPSSNT